VIWNNGDRMIGFHPLVFFAVPTAVGLMVGGLIISAVRKSGWSFVGAAVAGLLIIAPIFFGNLILEAAWKRSLQSNNSANQQAVQSADLRPADFSANEYPDETKMVEVKGFAWYCVQHHAAPEGRFRGFSINGISHVYISKIRHGMRGIAWVDDPARLPTGDFEYQPAGIDRWYVWRYQPVDRD
jgi:hypothetical protein